MRVYQRHINAVILLLLVLAPLIYYTGMQLRQQSIRHRMKEQLEKKLLQTRILERDELHWFKAGKELVLEHRLFDVKSLRELPGGKLEVTGLFDEEETRLVDHLRHSREQEESGPTRSLVSLFQLLFHLPAVAADTSPVQVADPLTRFQSGNSRLAAVFSRVPTPPPQA